MQIEDDDTGHVLSGTSNERNAIYGNGGNDYIEGGDLSDNLFGGADNDTISGNDGSDTILGQDGDDRLYGDGGDDYISDSIGLNYLDGGAGDDTITSGGTSGSSVNGGAGDDDITSFGIAGATYTYYCGSGDDRVTAGDGINQISGGSGEDSVDYGNVTTAITANLLTGRGSGGAAGDTYSQIEDISGTSQNDHLIGNGAYNVLTGGYGDDVIDGGLGGDLLVGGSGIDRLSYLSSNTAVSVNMTTGVAHGGYAEQDQFSEFEDIEGSVYNDSLTGEGSANRLLGGVGDDKLYGVGGNDRLYGGGGKDTLSGGLGSDNLYGEAGADLFLITSVAESTASSAGRDAIRDFSHAEGDKIDLHLIDANTAAANDQAFKFVGTAAFSGVSGELKVVVGSTYALVQGDVNGDKIVDFAVYVDHYDAAHPLVASDCVL